MSFNYFFVLGVLKSLRYQPLDFSSIENVEFDNHFIFVIYLMLSIIMNCDK